MAREPVMDRAAHELYEAVLLLILPQRLLELGCQQIEQFGIAGDLLLFLDAFYRSPRDRNTAQPYPSRVRTTTRECAADRAQPWLRKIFLVSELAIQP
jgi:hypothetical protein